MFDQELTFPNCLSRVIDEDMSSISPRFESSIVEMFRGFDVLSDQAKGSRRFSV
jgi:hypothetical protein